jgi:hypothetical protein
MNLHEEVEGIPETDIARVRNEELGLLAGVGQRKLWISPECPAPSGTSKHHESFGAALADAEAEPAIPIRNLAGGRDLQRSDAHIGKPYGRHRQALPRHQNAGIATFCSGVLCESEIKETQAPQGFLMRYVAPCGADIFESKSDAR